MPEGFLIQTNWEVLIDKVSYTCVNTISEDELIKSEPVAGDSKDVIEFIAAVQALKYCKKKRYYQLPIFVSNDSVIIWLKATDSILPYDRGAEFNALNSMYIESIYWLHTNDYYNPILKWKGSKQKDYQAIKKITTLCVRGDNPKDPKLKCAPPF